MSTPPERLRHELERQRERGREFRVAWPIGLSVALDGEPPRSEIWWRTVFTEQRAVWHASYSGPNFVPRLFSPESEDDPRTQRDTSTLVA